MSVRTNLTEVSPYERVTNGVRIVATPAHIAEQSNPAERVFAFSYTIYMENLSTETVQLLERCWLIQSGGKRFAEVVGPGVVGKKPVLNPGESFEYTSSAVIDDPSGAMEGTYTFRREDGSTFSVAIPRFDLLYPLIIH